MSYLDIYNASKDAEFQGRCRVATFIAAQNITNEASDAANHQARRDWAMRVLQDATNISDHQLALQVLRNEVIAGNPSAADDGALQYQVNAILADLVAIG